MVKQSSLKTNSYQEGSSVQKLMNEICHGENTKNGTSGVVARLMGIDTSLPKIGPTVHTKECFDENLRQQTPNMSNCKGAEVALGSLPKISPSNCKQQYFIPSTKSLSLTKPPRREHPHEEQLKKFKKEFEAWQDSKLWEISSNLCHYSGEDLEKEHFFALENLKKEKMAAYANTSQRQKKPVDTEDCISVNKLKINQNDGNFGIRRDIAGKGFELESSDKFQEKNIAPFSPTRIVILKPSSDSPEEPQGGSPEVVVEKGRSMEDFLEEVKEKLKLEMEGKGRIDSTRRFSLGHTSLHENSKNLKNAAWESEKHGAMLRRSQSMITSRNSFHCDGEKSSKSIKSATRKFISDRLKNVLNADSITAFSNEGKDDSFWEDNKAMNESSPKNLRLEQMKVVSLDDESLSPSNFVGSFSASFSEAQKLQKREEFKNDSVVVAKKRKKDGFSIKSTVSNLRRNLGLKAKFFAKKVPSMGDTAVDEVHYVKPDEATPSIIKNFGIVQDNSTEVPPSPASFPCSPINVHYSPVSPLDDLFADDRSSTQVSGELSTIITELGSQPKLSEMEKCGMETQTQLHYSNETILPEACAEAYIRDILLVSDLCSACWPLDQPTSRLDGQINPISSCLFDQMEPKSLNSSNVDDYNSTLSLGDIHIDIKMFLDLVKEALPSAFDAPLTQFVSKRSTRTRTQFHHGRRLIDDLLDQIHVYASPKIDRPKSVDKLVVWDLKLMPWSDESNGEISSLCGEVEWVIIRELIDDLLLDILV
ncbi:uncharacterized protein LOC110022126 isoform X2 [Phalaenopsis equestris]|uniref:uncharacterized protein LOC110022126 isoform X2 n=1 Tax=Phalaenopsis equestris TaxID=78828 RepID=UPI0009E21A7C|nr:uncharacterized protein LOC110022126 isoform X2 [Phalaenopsis equestris]